MGVGAKVGSGSWTVESNQAPYGRL